MDGPSFAFGDRESEAGRAGDERRNGERVARRLPLEYTFDFNEHDAERAIRTTGSDAAAVDEPVNPPRFMSTHRGRDVGTRVLGSRSASKVAYTPVAKHGTQQRRQHRAGETGHFSRLSVPLSMTPSFSLASPLRRSAGQFGGAGSRYMGGRSRAALSSTSLTGSVLTTSLAGDLNASLPPQPPNTHGLNATSSFGRTPSRVRPPELLALSQRMQFPITGGGGGVGSGRSGVAPSLGPASLSRTPRW